MELQGDIFKPFFGMVIQIPGNNGIFTPVGRLIPWKMNKCTIETGVTEVGTDNNAVPGFETGTSAKRKATGTVHQATFDIGNNIFGVNPHAFNTGLPLPFALYEGMLIRSLFKPDHTVPGPLAAQNGELVGVPILGGAGELLTPPFGGFLANCYIFLTMKIIKIRHEADASAGQPFDFDWHAVAAYAMPGESLSQITAYGFSATVGAGGFF